MKLDPECIRDILATIEAIVDDANQCYTCSIETFIEQNPALQKHPDNVVFYHINRYGYPDIYTRVRFLVLERSLSWTYPLRGMNC